MEKGVMKADAGMNDLAWNVVGHTYVPKFLTEETFVWHATIPDGTFVPPHIHPTQDEWIYILDGELEIEFPDDHCKAGSGDTIKMPRGIAHGIFNRSGKTATCIFGVSPARDLYKLFTELDGVRDPQELVRLSALREVNFLPLSNAD
ncbi:cupin domain-containing protein [Stappia sp. ES.058]|uniref:cupin domain-containing protein n=1 Tax=Stappia sp. ES.058 TaxID=1881061 RepID=UPI00087D9AC1|nr:cupin domain-containing protein [Stappia sp. ES.058]SDT95355.1 Cupin domain-containing protein [Stappia sp. ES.058]